MRGTMISRTAVSWNPKMLWIISRSSSSRLTSSTSPRIRSLISPVLRWGMVSAVHRVSSPPSPLRTSSAVQGASRVLKGAKRRPMELRTPRAWRAPSRLAASPPTDQAISTTRITPR